MVTAQSTPRAITAVHPMTVAKKVAVYDLIRECIVTEQPLVMMYNTGDEYLKPRVVWPHRLLTSQEGEDFVRGHDSLRDTVRSFRLARILSAHLLLA